MSSESGKKSPSGLHTLPVAATFELTTVENPTVQLVALLEGRSLRIGRIEGNDIVLRDAKVSRFHAIINSTTTGVLVSDLSSLNGTFVNTKRIPGPTRISTGDIVEIGDARLKVNIQGEQRLDMEEGVLQTQAARLQAVVVTVLVADVTGYTKMSEQLPPQDVTTMLRDWFAEVNSLVQSHGGTIDKYIGDGLMALWHGSAEEASDRALSALRSAREVLEMTEAFANERWAHGETHPWRCRVCLNSGEALMGTVGISTSREFTVLGDSVNTAFRLDDIARSLRQNLILSSSTADYVREHVTLQELGKHSVKGKAEEVHVFTISNT